MNRLENKKRKLLNELSKTRLAAKQHAFKRGETQDKFEQEALCELIKDGLIKETISGQLTLTKQGILFLKRSKCDHETAYQRQHQMLVEKEISPGKKITINQAESPLSRLYNRRGKTGARFLSPEQFEAGERLRRDFEASQIKQKTGLVLAPKVDGGKCRSQGDYGLVGCLEAKQRMDKAIRSIGPELGSLLIDVCCYLKGLELVERERQWPVRSAKVVLSVALNQLVSHYGLSPYYARGRG